MGLDKVRRMASEILKIGETKIGFDQDNLSRVKEAMTKEDVRLLIKEKIIRKRKDKQQSRARARLLHEKKVKGRKRGKGKRTGTKKSRIKPKKTWMQNVRAQRKILKEIKDEGKLPESLSYGKVYRMIKGNYFRGKKYVEAYVMEASK